MFSAHSFLCFKFKWSILGTCLTTVSLKSSKQATELYAMLHLMNFRLFEDTDLVRCHGRYIRKLLPQ